MRGFSVKMCTPPDYYEDEQEMDELLLKLFKTWTNNFENITGENPYNEEGINIFIEEVANRLKDLIKNKND